jgi:hypothetical protein
LDITAQDLLGKSHEELVLLLIHVRRQSAALAEAIDNERNEGNGNEARERLRDLEDQHARTKPIISLVDNMVKLGSLYRGPQDAPLSHRIRNVPTTNAVPKTESTFRAMSVLGKAAGERSGEEASRERRADIQVRN